VTGAAVVAATAGAVDDVVVDTRTVVDMPVVDGPESGADDPQATPIGTRTRTRTRFSRRMIGPYGLFAGDAVGVAIEPGR